MNCAVVTHVKDSLDSPSKPNFNEEQGKVKMMMLTNLYTWGDQQEMELAL